MYARKLHVIAVGPSGRRDAALKHLDSFAMRSFTGESRFDDLLPIADGRLEAGALVPLSALRDAIEDWFRRKSYLSPDERLVIEEDHAQSC